VGEVFTALADPAREYRRADRRPVGGAVRYAAPFDAV
jgi:hypothetical protein